MHCLLLPIVLEVTKTEYPESVESTTYVQIMKVEHYFSLFPHILRPVDQHLVCRRLAVSWIPAEVVHIDCLKLRAPQLRHQVADRAGQQI